MNHANYRKMNDRSMSSSTYHKKDGTPVRSRLKDEASNEVLDEMIKNHAIEEARFYKNLRKMQAKGSLAIVGQQPERKTK